jgi:hypothetical protein
VAGYRGAREAASPFRASRRCRRPAA